ncbi:DNA adenine methylase [Altericista sp. CCNU0014]|uniref:DNA adenine methylase n=1 Tax=Altericista sp. CCNU0014 TaxID=3082949 RepID=UPI00384B22C8
MLSLGLIVTQAVSSTALPDPSTLTTPPRPFLKWAGGKSRLIAQYQPYLPIDVRTYYEPFLGGGALFFHLKPERAMLSDINPELVNVYTCVRDCVEAVIDELADHAARHSQTYYYQIRDREPDLPAEKAARLIYLNKTCFNGLYRVNRQGRFNVPMGRYKNPKICDPELLRAASIALQTATLTEEPFDRILNQSPSARDFVYFDPPYHPLSDTSNFTAYSRVAFGETEQIRLRDTFAELAERGVKVALSNSDCPFIRDLYQAFPIHPIAATRAINSQPAKRGKIAEILVTSYPKTQFLTN